jgi:MFS family permease
VIGGVTTDLLGFRAVFWVYALMSLLTLAMSLRIPETAGARSRASRHPLGIGRLSEVDPYFRTTYVVLTFNTFVAMMRGALIISLLPLYVGLQLGHSSTQVGTLFGIYGLVNVLMIAPTGVLSDTRGRKAVVMPSTYLATLVFITFPLVSGIAGLSVLVVLTGVATGLALGTMATYTYDVIPEHARGRLQTLRRLFGEMGGIAGPILGGLIADAAAPSAAFWAFVPLQLLSALAITFLARESLRTATGQPGAPEAGRPA